MTGLDELKRRREIEAARIKESLEKALEIHSNDIKEGEEFVAFVIKDQCIGCDQCLLVCDDNAIELIDEPLRTPGIEIEVNKKALIIRDECTGCRLCVLACPTNAIKMIDR
tara:strand:- start:302 stop:634 length:333 start_codon:yes stop_codon:yes gene_type:complete